MKHTLVESEVEGDRERFVGGLAKRYCSSGTSRAKERVTLLLGKRRTSVVILAAAVALYYF